MSPLSKGNNLENICAICSNPPLMTNGKNAITKGISVTIPSLANLLTF